jgi:hypothetical protein
MESPMESIKTHLVVWLSGLITGLILMERWRRLGEPSGPTAEDARDVTATNAESRAMQVAADKPKVVSVIVAGTKSEVERARHLLSQVVPWARDSAATLAGTAPASGTGTAGSFEANDGPPPTSPV